MPPPRATDDLFLLQMKPEFTPLLHVSIANSTVVAELNPVSRARECDKLRLNDYKIRQGGAVPGTALSVASVTEEA
jgi:hypothetical protein